MPVVEVVVYGDGNPQAVESLKLRFELSIAEAKLVYPSSIRALLGDIADSLEAADLQESEDAVSDPEFVMMKVPLVCPVCLEQAFSTRMFPTEMR